MQSAQPRCYGPFDVQAKKKEKEFTLSVPKVKIFKNIDKLKGKHLDKLLSSQFEAH